MNDSVKRYNVLLLGAGYDPGNTNVSLLLQSSAVFIFKSICSVLPLDRVLGTQHW